MKGRYAVYAIVVTLVTTMFSWGSLSGAPARSSSARGSSWSSGSSGSGSYGGGYSGGGGHK